MEIKTEIIPVKQFFYNSTENILLTDEHDYNNEDLDLKSIVFFAASGFFFGDSTYFKNIKVLPPATRVSVDSEGNILSMEKYWDWFYNPIHTDLESATEAFGKVFEKNIMEAIRNKDVLFPLSGGMDSRTIAAAVPNSSPNLQSYSYEFENGVRENKFAKAIAKIKQFPYKGYTIPKGYLWDKLDDLNKILKHYSEFTHSRQISLIDEIEQMGDLFLLGHGGEIFQAPSFENATDDDKISKIIFNMMIKGKGKELGERLWSLWGLEGSFSDYVLELIHHNLKNIGIENGNVKVRAFIYKYVASRKNQVNIAIFCRNKSIHLPFLQKEVLNVICTTREDLLTNRKIQMHYIKKKSSKLATVPLQNFYPLNIYNHHKINSKVYLPFRAILAGLRRLKETVSGQKTIIRNWENQFLGEANDKKLQKHLFERNDRENLLPLELIKEYYQKFKQKNVEYVQPLSILLTLNSFCNHRNKSGINHKKMLREAS